jgi:hypothetical protein
MDHSSAVPLDQEVRALIRYYAVCRLCGANGEEGHHTWFSDYSRSEDGAKRALRKHNKDRHQANGTRS